MLHGIYMTMSIPPDHGDFQMCSAKIPGFPVSATIPSGSVFGLFVSWFLDSLAMFWVQFRIPKFESSLLCRWNPSGHRLVTSAIIFLDGLHIAD